jgi:predicted double-glycine peptidase
MYLRFRLHRFFAFAASFLLLAPIGCVTTPKDTDGKKFKRKYAEFSYASVDAVRQSRQLSCGAAALTSVLNYWKADSAPSIVEKELIKKYPAKSKAGYPILQLREMALTERFAAFAVTMEADPWKQLSEHLENGRPVICAVRLPRGRYFGGTIPLVETLDRQTVMSTGNEWKSHYVVAMGSSYREILLMDPKYGIVRLSRETFLYYWSLEKYAALICSSL